MPRKTSIYELTAWFTPLASPVFPVDSMLDVLFSVSYMVVLTSVFLPATDCTHSVRDPVGRLQPPPFAAVRYTRHL